MKVIPVMICSFSLAVFALHANVGVALAQTEAVGTTGETMNPAGMPSATATLDQSNTDLESIKNSDDESITAKVNNVISSSFSNNADFPSGRNMHVTTNNGSVTIEGVVSSDDERREIETAVLQVPGVTNVNNKLVLYK